MSGDELDRNGLEAKRNAGTCLALFALLSVGAGLFAMAVVIMPDLLKAVLFGVFIVGFILLHYVTWGRWLSRPRPGDFDGEESPRPQPQIESDKFTDD